MNTSKCQGKNQAGGACSATPQAGKGWCVWHDPDLVEQRRTWNREGGRAKSNKARARKKVLAAGMELGEIDGALCQAFRDVLDGKLEPGVVTAAANVAKTIAQIRTASDLEKRVEEIERQRQNRLETWSA